MESIVAILIVIIAALLALVLIFKVLGFGLKIITNPKVLLAALVICVIIFAVMRMQQ